MTTFTFIPSWVIQDLVVYVAAAMVIFYIIRREERPIPRLMELSSFTLLYASVFENAATLNHLYGYGRSLIMIFNVPLSIPLFEAILTYAALRLLSAMRTPTWVKPFAVGFVGIVADFSLDPVAVKQIHQTLEGTIGRWTWYTSAGDVMIYNEPVSNFTGWAPLTAYAAAFFLLGRWWHRRSGYSTVVGYVYPILASIAALLCILSPITSFLIYLTPFFAPGGVNEWVMLAVLLVVPVALLALFWRGRMTARLSLTQDFPVFFVIGGFPLVNLLFCLAGGFTQILWLVALSCCVMWAALAVVYVAGRRVGISDPAPSVEQEAVAVGR
jgi:hypothetical protein